MARKYARRGGSKKYRKSSGPSQEERKQQAKERTELALACISDLTEEAKASDEFQKWLAVQGKFHRYSFGNALQIMFQMPEATRVAGFHAWKDVNRNVCAGEQAKIYVWAPSTRKVKETDAETGEERDVKEVTGFRLVPVFDISQTEGAELPSLDYRIEGNDNGLSEALESMIEGRGIKLETVENLGGASGCSMGKHIQVLAECEGLGRARTLIHELAHEVLHYGAKGDHSRSVQEIEAEATTFVVLAGLGFKEAEKSKFYLAAWGGDREKLRMSMARIQKTAQKFIKEIQERLV